MIGQKFMVDMISKMPNAATEIKKADFDKAYLSQFKDVLSGTLQKTPAVQSNFKKEAKTEELKETMGVNQENKSQFKTFSDIGKKDFEKSKVEKPEYRNEASAQTRQVKETKALSEEGGPKTKEDAAVQTLAQMMGIQAEDLMKLLASMNIKPQDLTQGDKTGEVADKLSALLNFNGNQKQTLSEILKAVQSAVDAKNLPTNAGVEDQKSQEAGTQVNAAGKTGSEDKPDWVKLEGVDVQVVKTEDFSKIMEKLKAGIQAMTAKLQQEPQKGFEEISVQVKDALAAWEAQKPADSQVMKQNSDKSAEVTLDRGVGKKEEVQPVQAGNEKQAAEDNKQEPKESRQSEARPAVAVESAPSAVKTVQADPVAVNNPAQAQVQKTESMNAAAKVQKEAPIPKSEIIHQVVEKAKVVMTNDKSEMSMELKPESLGKLSLKIVTEHGIVAAKFVAESQQVKETLEANMQLLKDTLEKQGLSVQSFSVSVQQDSSKAQQRGFEAGERQGKGGRDGQSKDYSIGMVAGTADTQQKISAYQWSDSSINLTA